LTHYSDTDTHVYYDSLLDKYVLYTRLSWYGRRWVGRAESDDFRHWGPVEPILWPRLDEELYLDIYTNSRTEYPGHPEYHLLFPMFYNRYTEDSHVKLFSSEFGVCWHRLPGGPVIEPGEPDAWDGEFISAGRDLVPFGADRIALPYAGINLPHKYPRWKTFANKGGWAWAWWPEGRITGVVADEEGEFFTFPIMPQGRRLQLNLKARRGGEVRVGIWQFPGPWDKCPGFAHLKELPGYSAADCDPMYGDSHALAVHWKGKADIAAQEGEPVVVQFKLRSAELFSFEWL
jgi:hypothetical protein